MFKIKVRALIATLIVVIMFSCVAYADTVVPTATPTVTPEVTPEVTPTVTPTPIVEEPKIISDIKTKAGKSQNKVSVYAEDYSDYTITKKNASTIYIDIPKSQYNEGVSKSITVKSERVKRIRTSKLKTTGTRITVVLKGKSELFVEEKKGRIDVFLVSAYTKNVYRYLDGSVNNFVVKTKMKQADYDVAKKGITSKAVSLTMPKSLFNHKVSTTKFSKNNIGKSTVKSMGMSTVKFKVTTLSTSDFTFEYMPKIKSVKIKAVKRKAGVAPPVEVMPKMTETPAIATTKAGASDTVTVQAIYGGVASVKRVSNTSRVVIDIPRGMEKECEKSINVSLNYISKIDVLVLNENTTRISFKCPINIKFTSSVSEGRISVKFTKLNIKNFDYYNDGDRYFITLKGIKLTKGDEKLTTYYKKTTANSGKTVKFSFKSSLGSVGKGTVPVNDSKVDSIVLNNTAVKIKAKAGYVYTVYYTGVTNSTTITISKKVKKNEKVVVIDPGHGNEDPGAVAFNCNEKDFNLEIAKKLRTKLATQGVKVYLLRNHDVFLGLYERTHIANDMGATLFLSIHNNAASSASVNGTETYYTTATPRTKGLSGKSFATYLQKGLVSNLKSNNRGVKPYPALVVLKATKMTAALVEVGFMTNKAECSKLNTPEYTLAAAEGLCTAIITSLSKV